MFLKSLLNFLWKLLKSKWFWFILLSLGLVFYFVKNRNKNFEIERLKSNSTILNQSFKILKTKNGELYYSVNALTLKKDEFADANLKLKNKLTEMGIKTKNVQSISEINFSYKKLYNNLVSIPIVSKDTVFIPKVILKDSILVTKTNKTVDYFTKYSFSENNKESFIAGIINIPTSYDLVTKSYFLNKTVNPFVSDLTFSINDTLTVVPTINYKRVWIFFKRPKSVTVYVKSENSLFNLEEIKTYQITK